VSKVRLAFIFCLLVGCASSVSARQGQTPPRADDGDDRPPRCAYREVIIEGANRNTPGDQILTVVARPGDGDVRPGLSARRLSNARAYLTEFGPPEYRRRPEKVLLAVGERVAGLGRLEFYAGGRTVGVIKVARNADVTFGNCYPPDDSYIRNGVYDLCRVKSHQIYYPCKDRRAPRRKRRRR
jgi:hypothetical protein